VYASRSDPPTPRARVAARAAQRSKQKKAARKKERRIRRREHREQQDEEYQLCELQGLSPPAIPENSSSDEEEEEESNGPPPRGGILRPRHQGPQRRQRAGARAGRGNAHHRAVRGRGGARRGGAGEHRGSIWERCNGDDGRHRSACRTLEEEEARLLHLEVSSHSSIRSGFEGLELTDHPRPCAR
jgi:hypothetical protein